MEIGVGESVRWSVIVPSHNGTDTLEVCLRALEALRPPPGGHEVILIDNASTDQTGALLAGFAARAGAKAISEPRRGKSWALNTAIENAAGDMLVFLDDDVMAAPDLLGAYAEADLRFPDAGLLAGQVRPSWRTTPPNWLAALTDKGQSCGCTPIGREEGSLAATQVKGGNMAIRRSALGSLRFSTGAVNFGDGAAGVGGEDTELARRVGSVSEIRFVPTAKVSHVISSAEMTWRGVFNRYRRIGRGNAAQGLLSRNPFRLAVEIAILSALAGLALVIGGKAAAAQQGVRIAMRVGAIEYAMKHGDHR